MKIFVKAFFLELGLRKSHPSQCPVFGWKTIISFEWVRLGRGKNFSSLSLCFNVIYDRFIADLFDYTLPDGRRPVFGGHHACMSSCRSVHQGFGFFDLLFSEVRTQIYISSLGREIGHAPLFALGRRRRRRRLMDCWCCCWWRKFVLDSWL